jgi:hypothetical protein
MGFDDPADVGRRARRRARHRGCAPRVQRCRAARAGGRSGARTATFRARLLELEAAGAPVVIATAMGPDLFTGTLGVGTDLVVIATTAGWDHCEIAST